MNLYNIAVYYVQITYMEHILNLLAFHRITVEHWKDRNVRGGYYSWIKAVHLHLYNVNYNISLLQDHVVLVNGVAMKQYHNTHIVSVARILDQIVSDLYTKCTIYKYVPLSKAYCNYVKFLYRYYTLNI